MSSINSDIPITYYNQTGQSNFEVVVFTKNEDPSASDTPFVAWRVLKTQTSAPFVYPVKVAVGANWTAGGTKSFEGPFDTNLGATWSLVQSHKEESPTLAEDVKAPMNPGNTIIVQNSKPRSWSGWPYNFGLYKNGALLITQSDVVVGSQAVFQLTHKLYFGVVSSMQVGTIFKSLASTQAHYEVDLKDYTNGLKITLTQNPASGEYTFRAENQ